MAFYSKVVNDCGDIHLELEKVAQTHGLDIEELHFDLLKVHTLIRSNPKDVFKLASQEEAKKINEEVFFNDKQNEVIQRYDICIKKKLFEYFFKLQISEDNTELYIIFESPFMLVDDEKLFQEVYTAIEAQMAYHKILLRQMDTQHATLKKNLLHYMQDNQRPNQMLLKRASYRPNKPGQVNFMLKKVWEEKSGQKAPANAIYGAGVGDAVLEYIKPIQGISGRDLMGQYIKVKEEKPIITTFECSADAFEIKESPDKVVYFSKVPQYATLIGQVLKSFTKNSFVEMKSTNTPMFLGGVQNGMILSISAKNEIDNAIESNLEIEAQEIHIKGNVGKNVRLLAKKVIIEGQLHNESRVEADEVFVSNNKGVCKGNKVVCKYADRGSIIAQKCEVDASSGAQIFAREIHIKQLKSNNTLHFSKECALEGVEGSENRFLFSAFADPDTKRILEETKAQMAFHKEKAQRVMAQYQDLNFFLQKNQDTIDKIKNADAMARKALMEEESVQRIYHDFMDCLRRIKVLRAYLLKIQDFNHKSIERLTSIESNMRDARLTRKGPWPAFNSIACNRIYTGRKIQTLQTENGEMVDFKLDGTTLVRTKS
ncbi:FapA family protein [Helicobacter felis]|uniref:ATPase n=1 Tax=Helicobacter felis (strain ATCC 49179 / CCUG 28539 / NCTC 12436 / CS1) TaxID=936155 RepID=E7AAQ2_HELFC|nr:FapA family protein [Helicobacter felis]CBY82723.1 Putative ATPase [Helicobacter felis ATCC 49179]